jgi:hypothetical protein
MNVFVFQAMIQKTWLPSRCLAMGVGSYATPLTVRYLGSDVSLRSSGLNSEIHVEIMYSKFVDVFKKRHSLWYGILILETVSSLATECTEFGSRPRRRSSLYTALKAGLSAHSFSD